MDKVGGRRSDQVAPARPGRVVPPRSGRAAFAAASAAAVAAASVALAGCEPVHLIAPSQEETATLHEGTITADETWRASDNPHKVVDRLVVAGPSAPTLTIEPGVRVLFGRRAELHVGTDTEPGALQAVGTAGDPIEFMSQLQHQFFGYWGTIQFGPMAGPSRLEHVQIQDCGGTADFPAACIRMFGSDGGRPHPVLRHVRLAFSDGFGVVALSGTGFGAGSGDIEFVLMRDFPVRINADRVATLPEGVRLSGEGELAVQVAGGLLTESQRWPDLAGPYVVTGPIRVAGEADPILTLPAGAELRFGRSGEMRVGVGGPGGLVAEGTAEDPVVFTGAVMAPGGWSGLIFGDDALPASRVSNAIIEYGGQPSGFRSVANATFFRDIGPVIQQSVIRNSSGCGIVRHAFDGTWTTDFTAPSLGNTFTGIQFADQCTTN